MGGEGGGTSRGVIRDGRDAIRIRRIKDIGI